MDNFKFKVGDTTLDRHGFYYEIIKIEEGTVLYKDFKTQGVYQDDLEAFSDDILVTEIGKLLYL